MAPSTGDPGANLRIGGEDGRERWALSKDEQARQHHGCSLGGKGCRAPFFPPRTVAKWNGAKVHVPASGDSKCADPGPRERAQQTQGRSAAEPGFLRVLGLGGGGRWTRRPNRGGPEGLKGAAGGSMQRSRRTETAEGVGETQRGLGRRTGRRGFFRAGPHRWTEVSFNSGQATRDGALLGFGGSINVPYRGLVSGCRQLRPEPDIPTLQSRRLLWRGGQGLCSRVASPKLVPRR